MLRVGTIYVPSPQTPNNFPFDITVGDCGYCWYTANILISSVFDAPSIVSGPVAAVLLKTSNLHLNWPCLQYK